MDPTQELARLRTLDDAVVVGRGQRHHLADSEVGDGVLGRALELRRVLHGADADDDALTLHEPRDGVVGADASGVGEAGGGALEVGDLELAVAGLLDHRLVRLPELREVHGLGGLDGRHEELALALGVLRVDREAEVDVLRLQLDRLALLVDVVAGVHLRHGREGLDDGVADEVGERHLAAAGAGEVVVDDDAVVEEQLDRHRAHARGGGDLEAGVHVGRGARGRALERHALDLARTRGLGRGRRRLRVGGAACGTCSLRLLRRRLALRRLRGGGRSAAPSPSSKNVTQVGSREAGSALYWSYISSTSHWFVPKSGVDGSCEDSATASIASSGWFPAHLDTVRLKTSALARTLDVRFALPGAVSPTVPRGDPRRTAIASIGAAEQGRCAGVRLPQATLTTTSDKPWNVASAAASWWSEDR